jgi:hypothetical protein
LFVGREKSGRSSDAAGGAPPCSNFCEKRKRRVREKGRRRPVAPDQPKQKKPKNPTIINPAPVARMMLAKRFAECKFEAWTARSDPRA